MSILKNEVKKRLMGSAFKGIIHRGYHKESFEGSEFLMTGLSNTYVYGHPVGYPEQIYSFKHADVRFYYDNSDFVDIEPSQTLVVRILQELGNIDEDIQVIFWRI